METIKGKRALVVGMARSGIATAKILKHLGAEVIVNDIKTKDMLGDQVGELENMGIEMCLGTNPDNIIDRIDCIVLSPGVPVDLPFIKKARSNGVYITGEIELAYRLCAAPIIAITGTNGKTTTTSLTGEIFKNAGMHTHVVGNIGFPFIEKAMEIRPDDIVVAEISSFQLETADKFKPKVSAILNITEDHLNRHKSMENYINIKSGIFKNEDKDDWVILNADDKLTASLADRVNGRLIFFSRKQILSQGVWVENDKIFVRIDGIKPCEICGIDEIFIPGAHNLENALAAVAMTFVMGVDPEIIRETLIKFKGVEHRIEYVDSINDVKFYNDSKGTNPDASIKAVQSMKGPTVVIAGGMDKGTHFDSFIDTFNDVVTHMIVLGETADKLIQTAKEKGFNSICKVDTLEQAVKEAFRLAVPGGNVLLSPACASWDMFKDYEERGQLFKEAVFALRR